MHFQGIFLLTTFAPLLNAASISKRALVVAQSLPAGWTSQGCWSDIVSNRQLSADGYTDASGMTEESCISFCASKGYSFAGVEYAVECYCGHNLGSVSLQKPDTDCNMACTGDSSEACGGPDRFNVFSNGASGPQTNPGPDGSSSLGCYSDTVAARTLSTPMGVDGDMTVAKCTAACKNAGYSLAGVEYARECYCDNEIQNNATPQSTGCDMTCKGDSSEYCGGADRIDLYRLSAQSQPSAGSIPNGWTSKGCYTDKVSARTLSNAVDVTGGYTAMTIEGCINACQAAGYSLAGLEYSQECWCDSSFKNQGAPATDGCSMPCKGNSAETCGGADHLNVYSYGTDPTTTTTTTTTTTSTTTTTTTTTTTVPTTTTTTTSTSTTTTTTSTTTTTTSTTTTTTTPTTAAGPPGPTSTCKIAIGGSSNSNTAYLALAGGQLVAVNDLSAASSFKIDGSGYLISGGNYVVLSDATASYSNFVVASDPEGQIATTWEYSGSSISFTNDVLDSGTASFYVDNSNNVVIPVSGSVPASFKAVTPYATNCT